MLAVAGSRSRALRTISVRPPLSSVISRSAATLSRRPRLPTAVIAHIGASGHGVRGRPRPGIGKGSRRHRRPRVRRRPWRDRPVPLAVDTNGIDQHFCLPDACRTSECRLAVGVVAVRDEDDGLLPVPSGLGHRNGFDHAVVHRRATRRAHAPEAGTHRAPIRGPLLNELDVARKAVQEDLVVWTQEPVEKPLDRGKRMLDLSPCMLPLVSRTMPRLTGTRSALKCVTSTGRSSS